MAALEDSDQFMIALIQLSMATLEDHIDHMMGAQFPEQAFHALAAGSFLTLRVQASTNDENTGRPQRSHSLDDLSPTLVVLITPVQPQQTP